MPDLATVRLSADDFNSIRPDLRRALGLPDFDLKAGQSVSLAGLSIPAEHFNLLPESVRKAITGSTGRLPDGRVVKDLSGLSISAEEFNSLSLSRRREVSATVTAISATAVFLRLADGSLAERTFAGRVLASDSGLEKKVDESKSAAAAKVEKEKARLKKLIEQEEAAQKFVTEQSKVGVGLLNKVGDRVNREVFEGQSEFIQKQNEGLFALGSLSKLIAEQRRVVAEAEAGVAVFEVAVRNREYVQAVRQGRVQFADKLAMEALTKCGALILLAPDLSQALFSTGQGIEAPVASRMYDAGLCQSPGLYQGAPDAEPSFSRGVEILTKITKPGFYSPEGQLLPYGYEDTPWLMQQGLLQIERDPAYAGMISRLEQISKSSSDLQPLISALRQNGDKFSEFIERSQTLGFEIKANLCLPDADKKKLYEMRAELKKLIDSPEKLAPEVLEQLKLRFKAIDRGLMVLDPEYDARKLHPRQFERREELIKLLEQSTPRWDKKWDAPPKDDPLYKALGERYDSSAATHLYWLTKHEEYQKELLELNAEYFPRYALQKAVDFLARPESISESDFENWVVTDGVEIAFTLALVVAATAIIIASGGTATPIVLVAAGAALMAVGGHELIRELQYQNGIRSEGSRFGDFSRGKMIEECGYDRPMELGRDVVQPLAAEFAFEFALNLVCAGVGEGLGSLGGKALAAAERILPQNARLFAKTTELFAKFECAAAREAGLKRFMMILAKEAVIQPPCMVVSIVAQDELMMTAKRQGWALQETNALGAFALGVGTSALFSSLCVKGRASGRTLTKSGRQVNLELQVSCTQREFDSYVRSAKARNSVFEVEGNRVIERTSEGLVVAWERQPPGKVQPRANPGEVTVLRSEATGDAPPTRALSYNEQRLTQLSEALRAANQSKDKAAADVIRQKMHEILCKEAAAMCKELDLPGLVPTKDLLGLTFSGDYGTFASDTGFIKINMMGPEPFASLKHELTHLARVCHREALARADRKAFDRCIVEDAIAKIGTKEVRFDNMTMFAEERTPIKNKELMRDAVRGYFEKHGAKISEDLNHFDSIFDDPKYVSLVEELGGRDNCSYELMMEMSNVLASRDFVCGVSKKNLAARWLEPTVEKLAARYRAAKEKCGGSLDGYGPLKKYTAGAAQSREAQYDHTQYRFGPEETAAHRKQYAQQLAVMRAEMKQKGATPEQYKEAAEPQLLALKINNRAERVQKALRGYDSETDPGRKQQYRREAEEAAKELVQALEKNPDTDAPAEKFLPYLLERQLIKFSDLSPALRSRVRGPAGDRPAGVADDASAGGYKTEKSKPPSEQRREPNEPGRKSESGSDNPPGPRPEPQRKNWYENNNISKAEQDYFRERGEAYLRQQGEQLQDQLDSFRTRYLQSENGAKFVRQLDDAIAMIESFRSESNEVNRAELESKLRETGLFSNAEIGRVTDSTNIKDTLKGLSGKLQAEKTLCQKAAEPRATLTEAENGKLLDLMISRSKQLGVSNEHTQEFNALRQKRKTLDKEKPAAELYGRLADAAETGHSLEKVLERYQRTGKNVDELVVELKSPERLSRLCEHCRNTPEFAGLSDEAIRLELVRRIDTWAETLKARRSSMDATADGAVFPPALENGKTTKVRAENNDAYNDNKKAVFNRSVDALRVGRSDAENLVITEALAQFPKDCYEMQIMEKDGKLVVLGLVKGEANQCKLYVSAIDLNDGGKSRAWHVTLRKGCPHGVSNIKIGSGNEQITVYTYSIDRKHTSDFAQCREVLKTDAERAKADRYKEEARSLGFSSDEDLCVWLGKAIKY